MTAGPHVFGDGRRGLWVQSNANLTDKLKHFLPRLRGPIPNLTDVFLPAEATAAHRDQVRQADFFCHTYVVNHDRPPNVFVDDALRAHKGGALELNIEGLPESQLRNYVTAVHARVRATKPRLPLRINVVPFKGQWLPMELFQRDDQFFVCVQAYGGNMDELLAAEDVLRDLLAWGCPPDKASVMHAIMCSQRPGAPRHVTLPQVRGRASFYIDDLLLDAGLL